MFIHLLVRALDHEVFQSNRFLRSILIYWYWYFTQ